MTTLKPTSDGGRELTMDSPWGRVHMTISPAADGRDITLHDELGECVGRARIDLVHPAPPQIDPALDQLARARAAACETCPHQERSARFTVNGWPVFNVGCGLCGCAGLSLLHGECPKGLWPSVLTGHDQSPK